MAASKQALKTLIANGQVEQALASLIRLTERTDDPDLHQRVLTLSGQFAALKKQNLSGLLEDKDYRLQLNRITAAVADIVESEAVTTGHRLTTRSHHWKKWAAILGVLASIAGVTGYTLRAFFKKPEPTPVQLPTPPVEKPVEPVAKAAEKPAPTQPGKNSPNIIVKDKAKVGTIITGDSNKIEVKQDF